MLDIERLDELPRAALIELGRRHGIDRPERMTRVELRDELVRVTVTDERLRHSTRGWFGVARDLVASVVEAGLHMPDAAKVIRGDEPAPDIGIKRPPVATVTLAEIYAAQGHVRRALKMLDQVLMAEPDHEVAQLLKEQLEQRAGGASRADRSSDFPATPPPPPFEGGLGERLRAVSSGVQGTSKLQGASKRGEKADSEPPESGEVEVNSAAPRPSEPSPAAPAAAEPPASVPEPSPAPVAAPAERGPAEPAMAAAEPAAAEPAPAEPEPAGVEPPPTDPEVTSSEPAPALGEAPMVSDTTPPAAESESPAEPEAQDEPPASRAAPVVEQSLLLTIADAQSKIAYWELDATSVARGRALDADGHTALRLVSMKPSWDGAERFEHEVEVDGLVGRKALPLPEGSVYPRVAIGWRSKAGFLPLAVGVEISTSGEVDFQPPALGEAMLARAVERARSAARTG